MLRLAVERAVPIDPEPREVGERRRDIGLARAAAVYIVDTAPAPPSCSALCLVRHPRAISFSLLELAGLTPRETGPLDPSQSSFCCFPRCFPPFFSSYAP